MSQEPFRGGLQIAALRPDPGERQGGQRGGLDGPAMERSLVVPFPVLARLLAEARRLGLGSRGEDVEDFIRHGPTVEVGQAQREVGQGDIRQALSHPVQGVGLLEAGLAGGGEGVEQGGAAS